MKNILFLNHKQKQCGVYQFGLRTAMILSKSKECNFIYCEVENESEYTTNIIDHNPIGIIYNYHPLTMGWINSSILNNFNHITHYGVYHEDDNGTKKVGFDYHIMLDPNLQDNDKDFSVPRPLFENHGIQILSPEIPTIGSFGFGFNNKGFERLVKLVNEQFDEAKIRLHIPFAHYADMNGDQARAIAEKCLKHITKEKIELVVTHNFLTDVEVLEFLASNTINVFLYDEMIGRGISSVIDYALSINVPIAITKTYMFRHIVNANPSICIEDKTLKEIIVSGEAPLQPYRDKWSNCNLINKYENIINETLNKKI